MSLNRVFVVASALMLLLGVSLAASAWDGAWTDNGAFGQTQYFCGDSATRKFSGIYSEVGMFIGTLSTDGRRVSGVWYEAGLAECTNGTFSFQLSSDGESYSGEYACAENLEQDYAVFETRKSSTRPNNQQCGVLSTRSLEVLPGHYLDSTQNEARPYDLCAEKGSYVASFEFASNPGELVPDNIRGFEYGLTYQEDHVSRGFAVDEDGVGYVTLNYRMPGSTLVQLWWCAPTQFERGRASDFGNPDCHGVFVMKAASVMPRLCDRNRRLSGLPSDSVGDSDSSSNSASAVQQASMVAIVAAIMLVLAM